MNRLMTMIRLYGLSIARKHNPLPEAGQGDPYAHLDPGQWDKPDEVTRCKDCRQVKPWYPSFARDSSHPSGYRTVCKLCRSRKETGMSRHTAAEGGWKCPACGQRKKAGGFPSQKRENPRRPLKCLECKDKE
jgi:hypothetical protein